MVPLERDGIQLMSMGFLVKEEQAVIWRGPMLHKALQQFLQQTEWDDLDYLIIDLPPGTGDVSLTLSQLLGLSGAVVVCTPQKVARLDAVKAIAMFRQLNIPVLGIVENMAGEVFGRGGAHEMADQQKVPFLGEIPIETSIRVKGDEGRVADLFAETSPARDPLLNVCRNIALEVAREVLKPGTGPTLQIL
jgi:ATP-binding protein involved in chromosome partitioning